MVQIQVNFTEVNGVSPVKSWWECRGTDPKFSIKFSIGWFKKQLEKCYYSLLHSIGLCHKGQPKCWAGRGHTIFRSYNKSQFSIFFNSSLGSNPSHFISFIFLFSFGWCNFIELLLETEGESATFYSLLLWERPKFTKVTLQNCKFVINRVNKPWNASVLALNLLSAAKVIFFDYICK